MTTRPLPDLKLEDDTFTNPRKHIDMDELRELACHIGRRGLLNPLRVTPDGLIVAGQRRFRAIHLLQNWRVDLAGLVDDGEAELFDSNAKRLADVPVIVGEPEDDETLEADALADNVLHEPLSTYEVAARVVSMSNCGATGVEIARGIGKSTTYVSRMLKAWVGAGTALHAAWRDGLAYETVKRLADLTLEDQERALKSGAGKGSKESRGRPGIETVKECLDGIVEVYWRSKATETPTPQSYAAGVADALRWVAGQQASPTFVEFLGPVEKS
jgi:ParB-like chromosome segregation protein Spo0J